MAQGLIYHDTQKSENVSTGHFCKGYETRLRKNWLSISAEREVPRDENLITNLWLIMMDMVCAVYGVVYVIKSEWVNEWACITFLITVGLWTCC